MAIDNRLVKQEERRNKREGEKRSERNRGAMYLVGFAELMTRSQEHC